MNKKIFILFIITIIYGEILTAGPLKSIKLPAPSISNNYLLADALLNRKSSRSFSDKEISLQDLSNSLWCATGITRPDTGGRTYPSAMNKQDIEIYVFLKEGAYYYN